MLLCWLDTSRRVDDSDDQVIFFHREDVDGNEGDKASVAACGIDALLY